MKKIIIYIAVVFTLFLTDVKAETTAYIPENPTHALIVIHGFGGNSHSMSWMTKTLKKEIPDMAFYYPTAPDRAPVGGYQWFVIPTLGEEIKEKALYDKMMKDAMQNVNDLHKLVEEIHDNLHISYQNIYVAGFSQGGLMALLTALTNPHQLPVAISFSGVPLLFTPDFMIEKVKSKPDILLMQGDNDNVIPKDSIEMTSQTLKILNITPKIRILPNLNHHINQESIRNMIDFIK